jgi:hypothetical protein
MGGFCPTICLKVVSCRANVLEKKESGNDLDGFIDKMSTLVANQSERANNLVRMNS